MAYIANQNEEGDQAQNVATNIFQTTTSVQQPQAAQSGVPMSGGDQSTAIDSGGSGAPQSQQAAKSNAASTSKEVIRRNAGKAASPIDINQTRQGIAQAQTNLQREADNFVGAQKDRVGQVGDDEIQRGLKGDEAALGKVSGRLRNAKPDYQGFTQNTNTDFSSKLNELSDGSLKNYFKQAGGPRATAGEAAFDAMLLGKNQQFKQDRAAAQLEAAALDRRTKEIRDDANTRGKTAYDTAYQSETDRIRNSLTNFANHAIQRAEQQAAEENARREKLKTLGGGELQSQIPDYGAWLRGLALDVGQNDGEDQFLTSNADYGKRDFLNFSGPVSANNYFDAETAAAVNRAQNLLGASGPRYEAAGPAAPAYSFNADAAKAYLADMAQKNRFETEARRAREAEELARRAAEESARAAQAEERARQEAQQRKDNRGATANTYHTGTTTSGGIMPKVLEPVGKAVNDSNPFKRRK